MQLEAQRKLEISQSVRGGRVGRRNKNAIHSEERVFKRKGN